MARILAALTLAVALAGPAAAQVTSRAPEWARALLVTDADAVQVRQSALRAPEGGVAVRLSIAPAQGGVARLIRFETSPAGESLTVRRFTGHNRNGWVLWGAEQATPVALDAARRTQIERLARSALSASLLGGEGAGVDGRPCATGDFAWVEISDPSRNTAVERRCATDGAAGALIKALSEAAGSRDEEELYRSGAAEILTADSSFAAAAASEGLVAALGNFAHDEAVAVPGAGAGVRGREAMNIFFAGAEPYTWTPAGAEIAARGDMGWSWGRWTRGEASGDYVSVWKRDALGAWRFIARTGP